MLRGNNRREFIICAKRQMVDQPLAVYHSENDAIDYLKRNNRINMDNKRTSEDDIDYLNRMTSHTITIVKSTVETMYLITCTDPTKNAVTYNKRFVYEYIARQLVKDVKDVKDDIIVDLMQHVSTKMVNDVFHDVESGNIYTITSIPVF